MPVPTRYRWTTEDFRTIAQVQDRFEDDAARWVGPLLVCDTNSFVTSVFHEVYLGRRDARLEAEAAARRYHLLLLCGEETPFAQDGTGLRHQGPPRTRMHERYVRYLNEGGRRFARVEGTRAERLATAVALVDPLLAEAGAESTAGRAVSLR